MFAQCLVLLSAFTGSEAQVAWDRELVLLASEWSVPWQSYTPPGWRLRVSGLRTSLAGLWAD